jgi:hypothetical protein
MTGKELYEEIEDLAVRYTFRTGKTLERIGISTEEIECLSKTYPPLTTGGLWLIDHSVSIGDGKIIGMRFSTGLIMFDIFNF